MKHEFTLEDIVPYLGLFEALKLDIWIDGGWGVDALLGEQTRSHEDLDFLVEKAGLDLLVEALRQREFFDVPTNDHTPWNFVLGNSDGKNFDFHVLARQVDGNYTYGSPEKPVPVTAESLDAVGTIGGIEVHCPTPEFQIDSHTGYTLKETDIHDVTLLSEKFGLPLHPEQLEYLAKCVND